MEFRWQHTGEPVSMKRFLTKHGISMRLIKAIKHGEGEFRLDGIPHFGEITVENGDYAGIWLPAEGADPEVAVSSVPITVLYEDDHWLVVNKPAGLTSVPGPTNREDTLVNRVKGYLMAQQAENQKPHLITRLDRDTSGLVLVAKHRVAQSMTTWEPVAKTLRKTYLAWVDGQLTPAQGTITAAIGRVGTSPRREVTPAGQDATTKYWVEQTFATATQVKLELVTGRTHQIRVHLSHLGHPLLGDQLYAGPTTLIQRQALHAATLQFHDPFTDQDLQWQAPLPEDLEQLINQLK
ncbi:RluA family pseudouridine synthase [Lactobacillus sp.] [Lactiplantibacillus mudanjiangensis]|uniref:RluA family pseudouridine synthase n=1 Tax=Lactiplantibacillus mudanjiangensis TaxID=1296538 RepID=UPI0010158E8F|nr:RluA family pseudouridine synthase [Lactiplantibacillus mudanjiangensis]VDG32546.1 RluA family pseudouridine synthase [Lactobacillus sp.] [Lactiplantibacillus mudanjiangensis]